MDHFKREVFKYNDRVKMVRTSSADLDNEPGTVVGIAYNSFYPETYIVEMDNYPAKDWPWKCIVMTAACMEKLDA